MLTADLAVISFKYAHSPASSEMMSGGLFMLPLTVSAMRDWMMGFHDIGFWRKERPFRCKVTKNRTNRSHTRLIFLDRHRRFARYLLFLRHACDYRDNIEESRKRWMLSVQPVSLLKTGPAFSISPRWRTRLWTRVLVRFHDFHIHIRMRRRSRSYGFETAALKKTSPPRP